MWWGGNVLVVVKTGTRYDGPCAVSEQHGTLQVPLLARHFAADDLDPLYTFVMR